MNRADYTYTVVRKRKREFTTRILVPTLVTILLFLLTIFLIIIPRFRASIMDEKRVMIKELTNTAVSVLEEFEARERQGLMSRAEAQKQAVEQIRHLRYGGEHKDYFWISDLHPNMVMHPYRSDLQGTSLEQFSDSHGKKLFLEFVRVVKAQGEGYVEYFWQWKDDSRQIVPKLSYVKGFEPWGWIVGTGIYVEDVKKNISSLTHNLILISLAISLVMVLLLSLIMQQSIRIEEARVAAENDLLESMEKYRTLVQAATEGLLMVLDNRITFANDRVRQMTGYGPEELVGQELAMLLDDADSGEAARLFRRGVPAEGQFELLLKSREGERREMLVTVSPIALSERSGTILILKDVTVRERHSLDAAEYRQMIGGFGLAPLRLVLDAKGRIVEAGEPVARLLGYASPEELAGVPVVTLFAGQERGKRFRSTLMNSGRLQESALPLLRRDGSEVTLAVALTAVAGEGGQMVCEGIIEDVTDTLRRQRETDALIAETTIAGLFMEQPAAHWMQKLAGIPLHESVARAEKMMAARKTDVLAVEGENRELVGIVTFADIRQRAVFAGLPPDTPVFRVMSAPVLTVERSAPVSEVVLLASERGIDHLVVRDDHHAVAGVVHVGDIPRAFCRSQRAIEQRIAAAGSVDELRHLFRQVVAIARPLIEQQVQAPTIGRLIAAISARITGRIFELSIDDLGTPPVAFAFVTLGSEGRREQTLETDQDNAIIYEDVPEEQAAAVREYFARLSAAVCDGLHEAGFSYCRGNVMAKNPRWCVPLSAWKSYVSAWVDTPDPQNILDVSIFFDFRPVYGSFELAEELRRQVNRVVRDKQLFFYNFAENVLGFKSAVKITGSIATEKRENRELFDLKYAITPMVMFARIFALYKQIDATGTVERLTLLNREGVLSDRELREVLFGYGYLMQLRYRHQIAMADRGLPPDNLIDIRELTDLDISLIKKIFATVTRLQSLLNQQFKKTPV
ncbi:DUF294 nucleotidyltransferase-like domain-containing protein [Trichlorobacter ammonificans]|uniref:PAS domain S-box protein n=1 Tax=Trichlorobacter ammonificans TaxID=2916410 RepID=A0ABM9DAL3_9BACT|nr:DUF294 nucleotidyltransferase-like domain-containing protein [Trichlorobacter ammonificans]CAH2031421.1 conserved protein of unknown function [Trichlorobacter ammonificans]